MDELTDDGPEMNFELREEDGVPVVVLRGELDMATVDGLDQALEATLAAHPARMIVDATEVQFADSSAIAKLVQWSLVVDDVEVRGASPLLRRIITGMGLDGKLHLT